MTHEQQGLLALLIPPLPSQHLLTCELDGQELKTLDNCMSKLKRLDGKGRLWPQQMIMEVHRGYLVLSDIETKVRLHIPQIRGTIEHGLGEKAPVTPQTMHRGFKIQ